MPNSTAAAKLIAPEKEKFEVQDKFKGETLNYNDAELFDQKSVAIAKLPGSGSSAMPKCSNDIVLNEIQRFIQHIVVEEQYAPNTVVQYIPPLCVIAEMVQDTYPDIASITDIPREDFVAKTLAYGRSYGYALEKTPCVGKTRVDAATRDWHRFDRANKYETVASTLWSYIYELRYPMPEYDKDTWDVRKLGIPVEISAHKPRYMLTFTQIRQLWLKDVTKKYVFFYLQRKAFTTVEKYIVAINGLSDFLDRKHSDVCSLAKVNREIIEEYLGELNMRVNSAGDYNMQVSALKTLFTRLDLLGIDVPEGPLFLKNDRMKAITPAPDYFSDDEIERINQHIQHVKPQFRRMTFVLETCGMRLADLCTTKIMVNDQPCLKRSQENAEFQFTFYMNKVRRYHTIPVSVETAIVIQDAIAESRKEYGQDCIYVFSKSKELPISTTNYCNVMHVLCKQYNILGDDGNMLWIKGHTFRGTVATQLLNSNTDPQVIRAFLGQKGLGSLKHYAEIHSETMSEALNPIIEADDYLIRNMGKPLQIQEFAKSAIETETMLPLANGFCAQSANVGPCGDLMMCLACPLAEFSSEDLPVLENQRSAIKQSCQLAAEKGHERLVEIYNSQIETLNRVIASIKGEHIEKQD